MTVKELIEILKEFPEDMTVAVEYDAQRDRKEHKERSEISIRKTVWIDSNYPYNEEEFEYINLE